MCFYVWRASTGTTHSAVLTGRASPEKISSTESALRGHSARMVHNRRVCIVWSTRTSSSGGGDPTSEGRGGGRGGRQSPSLGQRCAPTQGPAGAHPHVGAGRGQAVSGVAHLGAGLAHGPALAIRAGGALVQGLYKEGQQDSEDNCMMKVGGACLTALANEHTAELLGVSNRYLRNFGGSTSRVRALGVVSRRTRGCPWYATQHGL